MGTSARRFSRNQAAHRYRVIYALLTDSLDGVRLRWLIRPHAVVCGVGEIGRQLVEDLRRPGPQQMPVVVVEADENNRHLRQCRDWGAIVKIGDARDSETLARLRLEHASKLFVCTGSDNSNIEVTMDACRLLHGNRPRWLKCFVHLGKSDLVDTLRDFARSAVALEDIELHVFDVFSNSARQLVHKHLRVDRPRHNEVAHYVVFGLGELGGRVALELAGVAQFENLLRTRMTILDEAMVQKERRFRARHPKFAPELEGRRYDWNQTSFDAWSDRSYRPAPKYRADGDDARRKQAVEYVCNAEFLDLPDGVESDELEAILVGLATPRSHVRFFMAYDDDSRNFDAAIRLRARLAQLESQPLQQARIYTGLPSQPGFAQLLATVPAGRPGAERPPAATHDIIPFGECRHACNLEEVERPGVETLARALYEDYCRQNAQPVEDWEQLDEVDRASNRHAADHMKIKVAMLGGYDVVQQRRAGAGRDRHGEHSPAEFILLVDGHPATDREREVFQEKLVENASLLARTEHNRYMAERLLKGWGYGKKGNTPATKILRESFCPWENLPAEERGKDYSQIAALARLLNLDISAQLGATVEAAGSSPVLSANASRPEQESSIHPP